MSTDMATGYALLAQAELSDRRVAAAEYQRDQFPAPQKDPPAISPLPTEAPDWSQIPNDPVSSYAQELVHIGFRRDASPRSIELGRRYRALVEQGEAARRHRDAQQAQQTHVQLTAAAMRSDQAMRSGGDAQRSAAGKSDRSRTRADATTASAAATCSRPAHGFWQSSGGAWGQCRSRRVVVARCDSRGQRATDVPPARWW